jgi:hypothetical protein
MRGKTSTRTDGVPNLRLQREGGHGSRSTELGRRLSTRQAPGQAENDRIRQVWLESQNLRVLRVSNDDVIKDFEAVVEAILAYRGEPR